MTEPLEVIATRIARIALVAPTDRQRRSRGVTLWL